MALKLEMERNKIRELISHESEYDLPGFVKEIRRICGVSRKKVEEEADLPNSLVYTLEHGNFRMFPQHQNFVSLGNYFGVSPKLLERKTQAYISEQNLSVRNYNRLRRI